MTDRVYPAAKPSGLNPPPQALNGSAFPAPKSQLYNPNRHPYRPTPKPSRRRRSCCHRTCICCIWFTIFILALILLAAIAGGVVWVLYRPQRPSFSVSSLKFSTFNLSSSDSLNSRLDLSVTARNPNKKLVFFYDPISIDVSSQGVDIGNGTFPALVHGAKNSTTLKTVVSTGGPRVLDSDSANSLRSDLKKKNRLPLEIRLETNVKVKLGSLKTNKVGIRVFCDGIDANIPKGNSTVTAYSGSSSEPNCHVKLRIKIWKFQF